MIKSFKSNSASQILGGVRPKGMSAALIRSAQRKLVMLDAAVALEDLAAVPGNRVEALSGSRLGQHSIRINRQFRLCFVWSGDGADDVEIVDYH